MVDSVRDLKKHDRIEIDGRSYLVHFHHMSHLDVEDMEETYHVELVEEAPGNLTPTHFLEYIGGQEDSISFWELDRRTWARIGPHDITLLESASVPD